MASATPAQVFISYSRTDGEFVDRLEADLRSRQFNPWVDRRRLEGGQDWQDELQRAVDASHSVCVVLTPASLESEAVKMEYRYAQRQRKPLIPLLLKDCQPPMELAGVQWIDFRGAYEDGLKNVIAALSRLERNEAAFDSDRVGQPTANLRDLYARALAAERQGNLEQVVALFAQIHDQEPGYLNGVVDTRLDALNKQLYPGRARRLWEDAKRARRAGEYGQEVGALQALIGLGPKDAAAEERLPIAIQNRRNSDLYDVVRELASIGDVETARQQLELLWHNAPYYEDPAGVTARFGLTVPPSYEQAKEENAARAARIQERKTLQAAMEEQQNDVKRQLEERRTQIASTRKRGREEAESAYARSAAAVNSSFEAALGNIVYIGQQDSSGQPSRQPDSEWRSIPENDTLVRKLIRERNGYTETASRLKAVDDRLENLKWADGTKLKTVLGVIAVILWFVFWGVVLLQVNLAPTDYDRAHLFTIGDFFQNGIELAILLLVCWFVAYLLLRGAYLAVRPSRIKALSLRGDSLREELMKLGASQESSVHALQERWKSENEPTRAERLRKLDEERSQRIAEIETSFRQQTTTLDEGAKQQIADIEAQARQRTEELETRYARAMTEIASRYRTSRL